MSNIIGNADEHKKNMFLRFLHHSMAMTGGFFACYAILLRADFMGNAQTSNWIYMVYAILGRNTGEFLLRLLGIMLYLSAAVLFVVINKKTRLCVQWVALFFDAVAIVILSFIPENTNPILGLLPIFFSMSFQWNSFPGSYGYVSSTIFSTNNTRQVGLALGEFLCDGDKKHLHKMVFFLGSLCGFHIGVIFAYYVTKAYGIEAIWFNFICLAIGAVLLFFERREESRLSSK